MFRVVFVAAALFVVVLGRPLVPNNNLIPTPMGWMPRECVHSLPEHSSISRMEGQLHVTDHSTNTVTQKIDPCLKGFKSAKDNGILPASYDGWEAYTAVESDLGFKSFVGTFSVPDIPKHEPQILYIFTGLQNIDWIPKVDREPSVPFDIIQPVLQYPGDEGNYWSVKSWYVTLDYGTMASKEVRVQPGDKIFGNMTKLGTDTWLVESTVVSTGQSTSIRPQNSRLGSQPWAYNTLECYGCRDCDTYPTQNSVFTDLKLTTTDGADFRPIWHINPKPSQDRKCNEGATVEADGSVAIFFDGIKRG